MTADVELLPLPEKSEIDRHLPTSVRVYGYTADDMKTYARANVAHAVAPLQAEIEALRAERDLFRDETIELVRQNGELQTRAERLAEEVEALRAEVERANGWNERVSVCRDHVADIVDGPCVICALDEAAARAERLAEALRKIAALTEEFDDLDDAVGIANEALERENDDA